MYVRTIFLHNQHAHTHPHTYTYIHAHPHMCTHPHKQHTPHTHTHTHTNAHTPTNYRFVSYSVCPKMPNLPAYTNDQFRTYSNLSTQLVANASHTHMHVFAYKMSLKVVGVCKGAPYLFAA